MAFGIPFNLCNLYLIPSPSFVFNTFWHSAVTCVRAKQTVCARELFTRIQVNGSINLIIRKSQITEHWTSAQESRKMAQNPFEYIDGCSSATNTQTLLLTLYALWIRPTNPHPISSSLCCNISYFAHFEFEFCLLSHRFGALRVHGKSVLAFDYLWLWPFKSASTTSTRCVCLCLGNPSECNMPCRNFPFHAEALLMLAQTATHTVQSAKKLTDNSMASDNMQFRRHAYAVNFTCNFIV